MSAIASLGVSNIEEAPSAVLRTRCADGEKGVLIYACYLARLFVPVARIVLDNAQRVNPQEIDSDPAYNNDGFLVRLI